MRTCAVEEELLLVDPQGGRPLPLAAELLELDRRHAACALGFTLSAELQAEQIESSTEAFERLTDLDNAVREGRFHADSLARSLGARVAALSTSPVPATLSSYRSPMCVWTQKGRCCWLRWRVPLSRPLLFSGRLVTRLPKAATNNG